MLGLPPVTLAENATLAAIATLVEAVSPPDVDNFLMPLACIWRTRASSGERAACLPPGRGIFMHGVSPRLFRLFRPWRARDATCEASEFRAGFTQSAPNLE